MTKIIRLLLKFILFGLQNILNIFSELFTFNSKITRAIRILLLKIVGINIGRNCYIDKGFKYLYPQNITIGNKVSLGHFNKIWAFNKIHIGDYVQSAIGLTMISGSHNNNDFSPLTENQEITLEGENWIGANVTILGGVTVGRGTIIGAGSVVNKDLPSYSICVGNPCKMLRRREPSNQVVHPFGKYEPNYFK